MDGWWKPVASPRFPSVADIREPTGDCFSCLLTSNHVDPSNGHGTGILKDYLLNTQGLGDEQPHPVLFCCGPRANFNQVHYSFFPLYIVACGILVPTVRDTDQDAVKDVCNHWTREVLNSRPSSLVEPPVCQMQGLVMRVCSVC